MIRAQWCLSFLGAVFILVGCEDRPTGAGSSAKPEKGEELSAQAILSQMASFLKEKRTFGFDLQTQFEAEGEKRPGSYAVRIERPQKIVIELKEGAIGTSLYLDGEELAIYHPVLNRYLRIPAPENIEQTTWQQMMSGNLGAFAFQLLHDDMYDLLYDGVADAQYLGSEEVDGVACHHCRFIQEDGMTWDMWIEKGEQPLPRRFFADLSDAVAGIPGGKLAMNIQFTNWDTQADYTDADFAFTPPAGAKEGPLVRRPAHPLEGKPAPEFTTVNLDGDEVNLASHVGKDVVILDFWATWCGPCIAALPILSEVASEYADRGVVFYAMNQGEGVGRIQVFLRDEGLDLPVVMDPNGSIGDLFGVKGIPQTVIIGKSGTVEIVHVGFSPRLGKQLRSELDELLAE